MKKTILISLFAALCATTASANYYGFRTNNCDLAAMHAELERAVRTHKTVITEVVCDAGVPGAGMVYAEPVAEPVYVTEYAPVEINASSIPVVDCVPGPITCGCNTCGC